MKKSLIFLIIFLFLIAAVFKFYNPLIKAAFASILLSTEVNKNFFLKPLKLFGNSVTRDLVIKTAVGDIRADIYKPGGEGQYPAILLTLGTVVSKEDEDLVRFSNALSKIGIVVMTANLPDLSSGYIYRESLEGTVDLYKYLITESYVDSTRSGFGGFCGGGAVVLVASTVEDIRTKVDFVLAVSPPYSAKDYSMEALTGFVPERENKWIASDDIKRSFIYGYTAYISDSKVRDEMRERVLNRRNYTEEELANLTENERSIYQLLISANKDDFDALYQNLPGEQREIIDKLSPDKVTEKIGAKVFILNDSQDQFVPQEETQRLARSLPNDKLVYTKVDTFEHVRPKVRLRRWEGVKQALEIVPFLFRTLNYMYR